MQKGLPCSDALRCDRDRRADLQGRGCDRNSRAQLAGEMGPVLVDQRVEPI